MARTAQSHRGTRGRLAGESSSGVRQARQLPATPQVQSDSIRFVERSWGENGMRQQRSVRPIRVPSQARHVHDGGWRCVVSRWCWMRQNRKPRSGAHSLARTAWAVKPKVWGRLRRPKTPSNIEDKSIQLGLDVNMRVRKHDTIPRPCSRTARTSVRMRQG